MSDWRDKSPGIERAQAVMRPMAPRSAVVAKYLRVSAYHNRPGYLFAPVDTLPLVPAIEQEHGGVMLGFTPNDDHPRSRIISAERVEAAVETATFLDICKEEGLSIAIISADIWQVLGSSTDGPVAQTLRGAYVGYHAEVVRPTGFGFCTMCLHMPLLSTVEPCASCSPSGSEWRPKP